MSSSIVKNSLCILHGRGERYDFTTPISDFLADVVSSQVNLLIVNCIVIDKPISRVVVSLSLILAMG